MGYMHVYTKSLSFLQRKRVRLLLLFSVQRCFNQSLLHYITTRICKEVNKLRWHLLNSSAFSKMEFL
jgi:hypothetical protein